MGVGGAHVFQRGKWDMIRSCITTPHNNNTHTNINISESQMHPGGVCAMPRHGVVMLGLLQRAMLHVKSTRESSSHTFGMCLTLIRILTTHRLGVDVLSLRLMSLLRFAPPAQQHSASHLMFSPNAVNSFATLTHTWNPCGHRLRHMSCKFIFIGAHAFASADK